MNCNKKQMKLAYLLFMLHLENYQVSVRFQSVLSKELGLHPITEMEFSS